MERLTKETPSNNREALFNYAYAKDREVWLRYADGEDDIRLVDYLSRLAKERGCDCSPEDILNGDACRECDCEVEVLNTVAIQAAELRGRLKAIEDILGEEYDLDHLRKIMEADGLKDLKDLLERYKGFKSAICDGNNVPQVTWARASTICRADKEGRVVVLPFKPGEYWRDKHGNRVRIENVFFGVTRTLAADTHDTVTYSYEGEKDEFSERWFSFRERFTREEAKE